VPYRTLRWRVFALASLFVLLIELLCRLTTDWRVVAFWQIVLYTAIFIFTDQILQRLSGLQDRVREESERFRAVYEAAGLGIILVGPDCMIRGLNGAAEMLSGWRREDLLGQKACSELISCPDGGSHVCAGLCRPDPQPALPDEQDMLAATLTQKNGKQIPVMISAAPLRRDDRSAGLALLLWDVSERLRLESEAALRRRQAEGLRGIGLEIAALSDLGRGMDRVLDQARNLFGMNLVAWGLLDESAGCLTWQAARGVGAHRFPGSVLPMDGHIMGRILTTGRPFVTQSLSAMSSGDPVGSRLFGDPPLQTAMAVPLRVRESTYGVLLCASTELMGLTDEDVMLFTHLGSFVATAVENAELLERVQHLAALEERQRLAREMHDGFGQVLTYLGVRHHLIARHAEKGDSEAILKEVGQLKQVLQETHTEVRRSIYELKECGQSKVSLVDRWRQILQDFQERSSIEAALALGEGVPGPLTQQQQLQLTRILQEALTNVRNHSGALSVAVRLESSQGHLLLSVADDGCGFEPGQVDGPDRHHFGLTIMGERADAIGAAIDVRSMRGHGTTVSVRLPLNREG